MHQSKNSRKANKAKGKNRSLLKSIQRIQRYLIPIPKFLPQSNQMHHLTNDSIQKHSAIIDYGKYELANKQTYSELQRYLDTLPKAATTRYNFQNQIYSKLKEIATDAVKASFQFLYPDKRINNFQIFELDFMIDSNFKSWLVEINTNPCLQVNCIVLQRIVPSMIENSFIIALDPLFPPSLSYSSTYVPYPGKCIPLNQVLTHF